MKLTRYFCYSPTCQSLKKVYASVLDSGSSIEVPVLKGGVVGEATRWFIDHLGEYGRAYPETASTMTQLQGRLVELQRLSDHYCTGPKDGPSTATYVASCIDQTVQSLSFGEALLFPLGFLAVEGSHVMLGELQRLEAAGSAGFSFSVINTGVGSDKYHEVGFSGGERVSKVLRFEGVPRPSTRQLKTIMEPLFPREGPAEPWTIDEVYARLYKAFDFGNNVALSQIHPVQGSNNCYYKCVAAWLQVNMGQTLFRKFEDDWKYRVVRELGEVLSGALDKDLELFRDGDDSPLTGYEVAELSEGVTVSLPLEGRELAQALHDRAMDVLRLRKEPPPHSTPY